VFVKDSNSKMLRFVEKNYLRYKKQNGLMDFTDILYQSYLTQDPLPVDVVFIDEAQDLTMLQWEVMLKLFSNASKVYIAGDDDQGVYEWAGADVQRFIDVPSYKVLDQSHRLPKAVHHFAMEISSRIAGSSKKIFNPRDEEGVLDSATNWANVSFEPNTPTLVLARTHAELNRAEKWLRLIGVNYSKVEKNAIKPAVNPKSLRAITLYEQVRKGEKGSGKAKRLLELYKDFFLTLDCPDSPWFVVYANQEEAGFIRRLLRSKENFEKEPNITLSTIHAAKGAESSHVVLALDFSYKTYRTWVSFMNSELRAYYVGVTRAKNRLTLKLKENTYGYPSTWN
jgi:superfamily I DNA/RNA helicase